LWIAFALLWLWLVWGSTYLTATWLLPHVPPFALSAVRFLIAGPLLGAAAWLLRHERPTRRQALNAAVVGGFLFLGGNGGTIWSQTRLPSSVTAVMVGLVPAWVTALQWLATGERPTTVRLAALAIGVLGVALLVGGGGPDVDPIGVTAVVAASLSWASGTVLSRRIELPKSIFTAAAVQMTSGGVLLTLASLVTGQAARVDVSGLGGFELACFLWLVLAGSVGALVAYNWLLTVVTPAVATTYAYVNPLVAVWLGWWLGGEHLGPRTLAASAVIVGAVALITTTSRPSAPGIPGASTTADPLPAPRPR